MSNTEHDRVADGINRVFASLKPEWRKVAYAEIAEHGDDQMAALKTLAAVLGLQVSVELARAQLAAARAADNHGDQGAEAGQPAPTPGPLPGQAPTHLPPATPSTSMETKRDDHEA